MLSWFEIRNGMDMLEEREVRHLLGMNRASMLGRIETYGGYCIYKKLEMFNLHLKSRVSLFHTTRQSITTLKQKEREEGN